MGLHRLLESLSVDLVRYSFDHAPAFVTSIPLLRESAFVQLREDYMGKFTFEVFAMVSSVGWEREIGTTGFIEQCGL